MELFVFASEPSIAWSIAKRQVKRVGYFKIEKMLL